MALKRLNGQQDVQLIHHSDRGCQYASSDYIKLLNDNRIQISMTESGDPKDYHQKKVIFNYTLTSSYIDTLSPKIEDNLSWIMPAH